VWCLGPRATGHALENAVAPELVLPDLDGKPFALSSLRGSKVFLLAWASWWGCRFDLPGWQALREDLHPEGFEVVTVALDTTGAETARPFIERAKPSHPSLIDQAHVVDALFGVCNVPMGVWIDESGMIVRPAEVAFSRRAPGTDRPLPDDMDPYLRDVLLEARKIRVEPEAYVAALRDWVAKGPESMYALSPSDVVSRSRARTPEMALAAANFELGQHLHRGGHPRDAVPYFREAHRLDPDNWTYKRQAWTFANPLQGPSGDYDSDWLSDVKKIGAANYYPAAELP
jgi:peroxiredoxin